MVRAVEHLEELDREREIWIQRRPYALVEKSESKPESFYFEVLELTGPPARFGVLVGDYVHNLRSALDHLVWQFDPPWVCWRLG